MEENIRVSQRVKEELKKKKGETGAESFNEVLERELEIIPRPENLDDLTANLHTGMQDTVKQLIQHIREIYDVKERVEDREFDGLRLVFTKPRSGYDVARLDFHYSDNSVKYHFLNVKREWEAAATVSYYGDELLFGDTGSGTYEQTTQKDVEEKITQTLQGALQRWSE